jgi:hypothetical protein
MSMSGSRRNIGSDGVSETRWEEGWTEQKKGKVIKKKIGERRGERKGQGTETLGTIGDLNSTLSPKLRPSAPFLGHG